ncbi:hypothetical protein [Falsibacillus albus]|uniref:DUF2007 domain-containing protein n=1 Tax=Falsibacillus albus TaxID=2478915 RepID=A0A3L7JVJ3_9BACI|nr:hypothetical protein [Falsibacillus albus]RLQ93681.1 hypothetical protein D9X91_17015 [Falsibacillus albus]
MERVQAYFINEDDAENVKAKLQKLNVKDLMVERVPEDEHRSIFEMLGDFFINNENDRDMNHLPHVLEFHVSEEDTPRAFAIIKENSGHIHTKKE